MSEFTTLISSDNESFKVSREALKLSKFCLQLIENSPEEDITLENATAVTLSSVIEFLNHYHDIEPLNPIAKVFSIF